MRLLTLGEAKSSRIKEIAQACNSTAEFLSLLNEATEALMTRGDWAGVVVPIHVCVRGGCITWPRYVGKVRRINRCGANIKIGNLWYDYIDRDTYSNWGNAWGWGDTGWLGDGSVGMRGGVNTAVMVNQGRYPVYSDVTPTSDRLVRAYCLTQNDVGKTVTIFGLDNSGQPLMTQDPSTGNWSNGVVITLAIPFGSTSVFVRQIDRVIKDQTQKNVPLFAYDPVNNVLEDLAVYEPSETNPSYERDRFSGAGNGGGCSSNSSCCQTSVAALVKLRFIPARVDTDLIPISNIRALKFAIQAIKLEEANQDDKAMMKMNLAVHELNLDLEDQYPRDQTPVDTGFMGGAYVGSQKCI